MCVNVQFITDQRLSTEISSRLINLILIFSTILEPLNRIIFTIYFCLIFPLFHKWAIRVFQLFTIGVKIFEKQKNCT